MTMNAIRTESRGSQRRQFFEAVGILVQLGQEETLCEVIEFAEAILAGDYERAREIETDMTARWLVGLLKMNPTDLDRAVADVGRRIDDPAAAKIQSHISIT